MASRQERNREWQRAFILERAGALFADQGYTATTMDQIAEAADFSKGALYNYFESKELLFLSMVEHGLQRMQTMIEEILEQDLEFPVLLTEFIEQFLDFFTTGKSVIQVLSTEGSTLAFSSAQNLGIAMREHFSRFIGDLARLIQRGQAEGVISAEEEPQLAALLVMGVLRSHMFHTILNDPDGRRRPRTELAVRHTARLLGIQLPEASGEEEVAV